MNWKIFFVTFISIFVAELGDKTQLATIAFTSSNIKYKWIVFIASATALVLTSFLGVFFGSFLTNYISPKKIKIISGTLFIIIGILILLSIAELNIFTRKANIIKQIEKVLAEEECKKCMKFNAFLKENKIKISDDNLLDDKELVSPKNCLNCKADYFKKFFSQKT
jgi:uncharacterized membrane protein